MTVHVSPSRAHGSITAPPSKSMAHRLLLCAGLCEGQSIIHGVGDGEDVNATLDCLSALGATWHKQGDTVTVQGIRACEAAPTGPLLCRESGSTLRFFVPVALLSGHNVLFTGAPSLFRRPLGVYETLCREKGLTFSADARSLAVCGPLPAGDYRVPGGISSQFISGLLFALPCLGQTSTVTILPPIESRSYIGLTTNALATFGVKITWQDEHTLLIPADARFTPTETAVEGDYSNAAFFAALQTLGDEVTIKGLSPTSLQGDRAYEKYFPMFLRGTPTVHIGDCPDLGPVLFALAAACHGGIFTGTARLRIKESDRAAAMAQELQKFGVTVTVTDDTVVVYPAAFHAPKEPLDGHNDHRIVMALSVLLTRTGGTIRGAEAVAKSFPAFFEQLASLGIVMQTEGTV